MSYHDFKFNFSFYSDTSPGMPCMLCVPYDFVEEYYKHMTTEECTPLNLTIQCCPVVLQKINNVCSCSFFINMIMSIFGGTTCGWLLKRRQCNCLRPWDEEEIKGLMKKYHHIITKEHTPLNLIIKCTCGIDFEEYYYWEVL